MAPPRFGYPPAHAAADLDRSGPPTDCLRAPLREQKTHLAIALALKATERGCKVRLITAADLTLQLEKARREDRFDQYLRRAILCSRLLVLDEIG